jgi:hypothetical protein
MWESVGNKPLLKNHRYTIFVAATCSVDVRHAKLLFCEGHFFIFWYCGVSFVGWTKCIQLAWYVHIKPSYPNYFHELSYRTQPFWDKIVPEIVSGFISILLRQVTRKNWCLMTWCSWTQTIRGVLWLNGLIFKNAGNPCVLMRVPIDFPETNQLRDTLCEVPVVAQRVAAAEARWKT